MTDCVFALHPLGPPWISMSLFHAQFYTCWLCPVSRVSQVTAPLFCLGSSPKVQKQLRFPAPAIAPGECSTRRWELEDECRPISQRDNPESLLVQHLRACLAGSSPTACSNNQLRNSSCWLPLLSRLLLPHSCFLHLFPPAAPKPSSRSLLWGNPD